MIKTTTLRYYQRWTIILAVMLLSIVVDRIEAITIVDHYPTQQEHEQFIVEHRVTYEDAIAEARNMKIYPGPIPGCKECTSAEMTYCRDESVINDHCCCEGAYNKVFPFVEHTCRLSQQACEVLAGDCAEYTRLRECCCHPYLLSHWKYMAGSSSEKYTKLTATIGIVTTMFHIFFRLLL